ncbi:MAG: tryptophan 7-halogenase [Gammaproteobacteria bacterium]|nr:tryptophan 7-halogenase [Gammaproteobacteria bacterium]
MKPIKKIVIAGGGTSGWLAASILSHQFSREQLEIELVESEQIGTIGVGESTIPPFVGLINNLGINEKDFIKSVHGTFKVGIEFPDWSNKGDSYFHPFGSLGIKFGVHEFYQAWLKAKYEGNDSELQSFSPCNVMAKSNKFFPPQQAKNSPLSGASYALHVDASLVAKYLNQYCNDKGVVRTEGKIVHVQNHEDGRISSLKLDSGKEITGDFFIDCTGFSALLIEKNMGIEYEDWLDYLPCDKAVAVQTKCSGEALPYTVSTARDHGWSWRIPLQHRVGNGYVYSSKHCSDEEAKKQLLEFIDGEPITEPVVIPFKAGIRKSIWNKNCLSLGLSSGFIEPLEATAIHLVQRSIDLFLKYYPDQECEPTHIEEYNRRMRMDYEEIRDFIVLHYCLTNREDTEFWKHCKTMDIPQGLKERIELFKSHGNLREGIDELFRAPSWQSVFEGMNVRPQKYCPRVNNLDSEMINKVLNEAKESIQKVVDQLPTHQEFLDKNCKAN